MSASFDSKFIKFSTVVVGGYDADYQAVYNAMTNKPAAANATAQNAFVVAAKAHGYWTIFDVFYFFAQDSNSASEALINWKAPGTNNASNVHATVWTTLQGFTGAANDYINTNFNPSTEGVNFTQNSASYGAYIRNNSAQDNNVMGNLDGDESRIMIRSSSGYFYWRLNSAANSDIENTDSRGLFAVSRPNATTQSGYINGVNKGNGSVNSVAIVSQDWHVCGWVDYGYSTYQVSMAFMGGSLSDAQQTSLYTDFQALMTALGTQV